MKNRLIPNLLFIISGSIVVLLLLAGWIFKIESLFLFPIPFISITLLIWAAIKRNMGWLISVGNVSAILIAIVIILLKQAKFEFTLYFGIILTCTGIAWLLIFLSTYFISKKFLWWTIIPAGVILSSGICLLYSTGNVLDFAFITGIGLGITLLIWGIGAKKFGLIIPGSLILTIAPGINFSWRIGGESNPISQTGIMLVWFGLGWALITISSRVIRDKFVWWPLIPSGVLEMVGIGLFLGGNPNITVGFLNNSTLMSLLLFGCYIFLLRLNFRK